MDFYEMPPGTEVPEVVNVIVEIPKGTRNKIEYDPTDRVFRLDRVLYSPVYYPGDYGFIPGTLSKDGDALDVLVLVTDPTFTGCVLQARPIGVLEMRDEKGFDEKILAVPAHDPRFDEISDLSNLPDPRSTRTWRGRRPRCSAGIRRTSRTTGSGRRSTTSRAFGRSSLPGWRVRLDAGLSRG
jgi:inorganic pyrophosphatase